MEEKYMKYLHYLMKYSYGIKTRSKKKGLQIYRYDGVIIVLLNDYANRRCLIWYFEKSTKKLFRVAYHGYYVRPLRIKINKAVEGIQNDPEYFDKVIKSRRSYSYKRERAFKRYTSYQRKLNK